MLCYVMLWVWRCYSMLTLVYKASEPEIKLMPCLQPVFACTGLWLQLVWKVTNSNISNTETGWPFHSEKPRQMTVSVKLGFTFTVCTVFGSSIPLSWVQQNIQPMIWTKYTTNSTYRTSLLFTVIVIIRHSDLFLFPPVQLLLVTLLSQCI